MRRFLLVFAVFCVFCAANPPLWKAIFGSVAKVIVRTQAGCRLAYRELTVEGGSLILDDAVLFDVSGGKSAFFLQAERISLHVSWSRPLEFFFQIQKPRLVLSEAALKKERKGRGDWRWRAEVVEGTLEWMDEALEPARFSFERLGGNHMGELHLRWGTSSLQLIGLRGEEGVDWHIEGQELSLLLLKKMARLGGFVREGIEVDGSVSGAIDLCAGPEGIAWKGAKLEGKELLLVEEQNMCRGTISLDWVADRFRFSLEKGMLVTAASSLEEVAFLATYRAGVGAKWECQSVAKTEQASLPFLCVGKGFFDPDHPSSIGGQWELGSAKGHFVGEDPDHRHWMFEWEHLQRDEAVFLQGLVVALDSRALEWEWLSGVLSGKCKVSVDPWAVDLLSLHGEEMAVRSVKSEVEAGSSRLTATAKEWTLERGWIQGTSWGGTEWKGRYDLAEGILQLEGLWEGKPATLRAEKKEILFAATTSVEGLFQLEVKGQWEPKAIQLASIEGHYGALSFAGRGEVETAAAGPWNFALLIPRFEGEIEPWIYPLEPRLQGIQGHVAARGSGFELCGEWGSALDIADWSLELQWSQGEFPISTHCRVEQLNVEMYADPEKIDFVSAKGSMVTSLAGTTFAIPWEAPRVKIAGDSALFDVRIQGKVWDFARLSGRKEGSELWIDPARSHLFGTPLTVRDLMWEEGLAKGALKVSVPWNKFGSLLAGWKLPIEGSLNFDASFERGKRADVSIFGLQWNGFETPYPLELNLQQRGVEWTLHSFSMGPLAAHCTLEADPSLLRLKGGEVKWGDGISSAFEGKWTGLGQADFVLQNMQATLERIGELPWKGWRGTLKGEGCLILGKEGIELDLDANLRNIQAHGFSFENTGPIHFFFASGEGALVKGIDCRIAKDAWEFHSKVDLLQFHAKKKQWLAEKTQLHLPAGLLDQFKQMEAGKLARFVDEGKSIDVVCDLGCAVDGSEFFCAVKEGLFPLAGEARHVRDLSFVCTPEKYFGSTLFAHQGNWARGSLEVDRGTLSHGRIFLQDADRNDETPLAIQWAESFDQQIEIESIEGSFAGIDASFHSLGGEKTPELIGSARFDFRRLSEWIPPAVSEVFHQLEMGRGYELKGSLFIDRKNLADFHFEGIFSGKQLELFGFELRTLLAQVDLTPSTLRIYDVKISDSAGSLKIDQILLQEPKGEPWTIEIPKFVIEDLRPSLLHSPGQEPGELTPLLVRRLTMTQFHGLLADGATYQAEGNLTFINSFKREKSVFDLPADVLGRIIGLDLELLVPVTGELFFELNDGFFQLTELRHSFSEGERSQFFLVENDFSPRMDLDGNLQILVKMKQFVLFTLTEGFYISIEGKLNNPRFRLQKKQRFFGGGEP
ncbi:MAG: hypothetical protein KGJ02_07855 [Verrucomicrobiota bacterium]|nr:hypothetical protein [Verrucomicrobiota bacterium]